MSEAWKPLPLHTLPGPLAAYAEELGAALDVDPAVVVVPGLVALAGAIGRSRTLYLGKGWTEPAVLFGAVISPPGLGPTSAMRASLETLPSSDFISPATLIVERPPGSPVGRYVLEALQRHPRGVVLACDALEPWLVHMRDAKSGYAVWLEFFANRDNEASLVNLYGLVDSRCWGRMVKADFYVPLWARFLVAWPPERVGTSDFLAQHFGPVPYGLPYRLLLAKLHESQAKGFREIHLATAAQRIWSQWLHKSESLVFLSPTPPITWCARLALVLACAEDKAEVDVPNLLRAIRLARWFTREWHRCVRVKAENTAPAQQIGGVP